MSSSFTDATVKVSWVFSHLDGILRSMENTTDQQSQQNQQGEGNRQAGAGQSKEKSEQGVSPRETIRRAIQSMKNDLVAGSAGITVSDIIGPCGEKSFRITSIYKLTMEEMTPARLNLYFGVKIPSRWDLMQNELKLSQYSRVLQVPPQLGLASASFTARYDYHTPQSRAIGIFVGSVIGHCSSESVNLFFHLAQYTYYSIESNLKRLARFDRYDCPDISARLAMDLLILECQVVLVDTYTEYLKNPDPYSLYGNEPSSLPSESDRNLPCRIFPDANLSVTVKDPSTKAPVTIIGRADWVFGVPPNNVLEYFAAIRVVEPRDFSSAETQLLTDLAIIRQCQIQAHGSAMGIHGFYSDGAQYVFICISAENKFHKSRIYGIWNPEDLRIIFNYVVWILDHSLKYLGC